MIDGQVVRMSRYLLATSKQVPANAHVVSHQLMIRSGMIQQEAAGIYAWLPLGLRVLRNIEAVVRAEMVRAGAIEVLMPTVHLADLWRESGRYEDYGDEMLRMTDRHGRQLLYGPTAEEIVTDVVRTHVRSYRNLPKILYNIQWKFRDERRPRFGVMRGREFLMKDAYSFDIDEAGARRSYERMFVAYLNIFAQLGLRAIPVAADPGPIGGDLSHEFIVLADTGESEVYCDRTLVELPAPGGVADGDLPACVGVRTSLYAANEETHNEAAFASVQPERRLNARGIEVGHIFYFGCKYSAPMKASVTSPDGEERLLHGGSYGIGVSRLVAAIIEACHDSAGIVWPDRVTPFDVGLINISPGLPAADSLCERVEAAFEGNGVQALVDDTDRRAGEKFAEMDLLGLPWQVIVGSRHAHDGNVELKRRATGERSVCDLQTLLERIKQPSNCGPTT